MSGSTLLQAVLKVLILLMLVLIALGNRRPRPALVRARR